MLIPAYQMHASLTDITLLACALIVLIQCDLPRELHLLCSALLILSDTISLPKLPIPVTIPSF